MIRTGKLFATLLMTCLALFAIQASAFVQSNDPLGTRVRGRITSITDNSIVVERRDGTSATISTSSETTFVRNGQPATLDDFLEGDGVTARGSLDPGGTLVARAVRGTDRRPNPDVARIAGVVVSVDPAQSAITITTEAGSTAVIYATSDTHIIRNRQQATVSDFLAGDRLRARGERDPNNQFIAERILGGSPPAQ